MSKAAAKREEPRHDTADRLDLSDVNLENSQAQQQTPTQPPLPLGQERAEPEPQREIPPDETPEGEPAMTAEERLLKTGVPYGQATPKEGEKAGFQKDDPGVVSINEPPGSQVLPQDVLDENERLFNDPYAEPRPPYETGTPQPPVPWLADKVNEELAALREWQKQEQDARSQSQLQAPAKQLEGPDKAAQEQEAALDKADRKRDEEDDDKTKKGKKRS